MRIEREGKIPLATHHGASRPLRQCKLSNPHLTALNTLYSLQIVALVPILVGLAKTEMR